MYSAQKPLRRNSTSGLVLGGSKGLGDSNHQESMSLLADSLATHGLKCLNSCEVFLRVYRNEPILVISFGHGSLLRDGHPRVDTPN